MDLEEIQITQRDNKPLDQANRKEHHIPAEEKLYGIRFSELFAVFLGKIGIKHSNQNNTANPKSKRRIERRHRGSVVFHRIDSCGIISDRRRHKAAQGFGIFNDWCNNIFDQIRTLNVFDLFNQRVDFTIDGCKKGF